MKIKLHLQNNGCFFSLGRWQIYVIWNAQHQLNFNVESNFLQNVNCSVWTAMWYVYILTEHVQKKYQEKK